MRRCFVFAAGTFYGLRERPGPGDLTIAADAGWVHCMEAGIVPDLVLGDFDSMDAPDFPRIERFPVEKDDTDMMLALRRGVRDGCQAFFLYGGTGGRRPDHTIANMQGLLWLRRHGARGLLYDDHLVWTAIEDETLEIRREVDDGVVSVFAMDGTAEGVDLEGLRYPLRDGVLTASFPLGVGNHFTEATARIRVRRGALLIGWELP